MKKLDIVVISGLMASVIGLVVLVLFILIN